MLLAENELTCHTATFAAQRSLIYRYMALDRLDIFGSKMMMIGPGRFDTHLNNQING
jgi:hypothetical protein